MARRVRPAAYSRIVTIQPVGLAVARRAQIPPFHVMDVWAAAAERQRTHGDLVNLSAGQPSTPAPIAVREAATAALAGEVLGYTVALGIPPAACRDRRALRRRATVWTWRRTRWW